MAHCGGDSLRDEIRGTGSRDHLGAAKGKESGDDRRQVAAVNGSLFESGIFDSDGRLSQECDEFRDECVDAVGVDSDKSGYEFLR
jgi:hypothetical protein